MRRIVGAALLATALALPGAAAASDGEAVWPLGVDFGLQLGDGWGPSFEARTGLLMVADFGSILGQGWAGLVASGGYSVALGSGIGALAATAGFNGAGLEAGVVSDFDDVGLRLRGLFPSALFGLSVGVDWLDDVRLMGGLVLTLPVMLDQ